MAKGKGQALFSEGETMKPAQYHPWKGRAMGAGSKSKTFLGGLCHRGHTYGRTDKSMRYVNGGACVVCMKENNFLVKLKRAESRLVVPG